MSLLHKVYMNIGILTPSFFVFGYQRSFEYITIFALVILFYLYGLQFDSKDESIILLCAYFYPVKYYTTCLDLYFLPL